MIRLDGTNADEGRAILAPELNDMLMMETTMLDAARKAAELAAADQERRSNNGNICRRKHQGHLPGSDRLDRAATTAA